MFARRQEPRELARKELTVVRLSQQPMIHVKVAAAAPEIHPLMSSKWRKGVRDGRLWAQGRLALLVLLAAASRAALAQQPASDSALVGHWSAAIGGAMWDLHINADRSYSIGTVSAAGDTLVVSMGRWAVRGTGGRAAFCILPVGRKAICGRLSLLHPYVAAQSEWRFADADGGPFGWLAYRRGYAPWDTLPISWRERDVYALSELTVRPELLGCAEPLVAPPETATPLHVEARFVVEPDGKPSAVEVVNPPNAAVAERVSAIVRSCRLEPGRLANGRAVRVLVQLRFSFPARVP